MRRFNQETKGWSMQDELELRPTKAEKTETEMEKSPLLVKDKRNVKDVFASNFLINQLLGRQGEEQHLDGEGVLVPIKSDSPDLVYSQLLTKIDPGLDEVRHQYNSLVVKQANPPFGSKEKIQIQQGSSPDPSPSSR